MSAHRVVIIEDDPALLRGLKDNFAANGFVVSTAMNGERGLDLLLGEKPDLVILDLMLPRMNGYAVCEAARARQLRMPIIMLTAKGQEDDIVRGLDAGADDYVTKPFSIRELLARSKAFLRRNGEAANGNVYQFGTYRMDLDAHKLFQGGEEVVLTGKEFKLLEFFLRRPGRALTRQGILDGVWGDEVIVTERSVDRCVTTLRGKIEPNPKAPSHIKTVRDIGYRFEA